MHETFSRLINRRDEEMFSFFQPDTQILLEYQPVHRHHLTPKSRDCSAQPIDKSSEVLPDQPLSERSLCPYHHVLNYDEKRIPAAISEVECSCQHVKVNGGTIHCEPMIYNMRVMVFDDACDKYVERVQKVAMACIPVFSNHISSGTLNHSKPLQPSTPL
uniref:Alpha-1,6-mannosyl-glycoprotein 6-beta-N-acetylglucosaminyltransferase n=1 Tax=Caenorhabditis tropicalis TaxID=1561998 RepID=A0A1I7UZ88_9PELO